MPITQDRLIALINIVDQALSAKTHTESMIRSELDASLTDFYARDGNANPLASDLLARLQTIESLISIPLISNTAIETLATEREHFKNKMRSNERARKAMERKRNKYQSEPTELDPRFYKED